MQLGIHIGQQNMSMAEMRALWRRCDGGLDWISMGDHLDEAAPESAVGRLLGYRGAVADMVNVAIRAPIDHAAFDADLARTVPAVRAAVAS